MTAARAAYQGASSAGVGTCGKACGFHPAALPGVPLTMTTTVLLSRLPQMPRGLGPSFDLSIWYCVNTRTW